MQRLAVPAWPRQSERDERRRVEGGAKIAERRAGGQRGRHRRKDIAAVKGAGARLQHEALVGQLHRFAHAAQRGSSSGQQPVVRPDQHVAAPCAHGDGPALGADPRIHHAHVDANRHIGQHVDPGERAPPDVKRRDLVRDVHQPRIRCAPHDHATAAPCGIVAVPKISHQRDAGHRPPPPL